MRYLERLFLGTVTILTASAIICIFTSTAQAADDPLPEVEVVDSVDIPSFMGKWYLIAEIPTFFERRCAGGQAAEYTLNDDGSVTVVNSCFTRLGFNYARKGYAEVVDETTNAKLAVSFVRFFRWWLFFGDYWIVELDENYEYAVIGHPTRNYGWVLSRECSLDQTLLDGIFDRLEAQYYDLDRFIMIDQSKNGCE